MTNEQYYIILHALGLSSSKSKRAKGFRNYYVSDATSDLEAMREAGWLVRRDPTEWMPDYTYRVTKRGLAAAGLTTRRLDEATAKGMPE